MPRRKKPFIGAGKALVNGGRFNPGLDANDGKPVATTPRVEVDTKRIQSKVEAHLRKFDDELAQLADRNQFIRDIVNECAAAQMMRLDHLVKGTRTKPSEWMTQILARTLATVMQSHGLEVTVSEYEKRGQRVRSLYLRLVPGLIKICFSLPKDIRGLARRAMRIKHQVFATGSTPGNIAFSSAPSHSDRKEIGGDCALEPGSEPIASLACNQEPSEKTRQEMEAGRAALARFAGRELPQ